jgi:hypothetical protein
MDSLRQEDVNSKKIESWLRMMTRWDNLWRSETEVEEEEIQENDPRFAYDEDSWNNDNFFEPFVQFLSGYDDFDLDIEWLFEEEDDLDISRLFEEEDD